MIRLEEALNIIESLKVHKPHTERVGLEDALHRVLAEDIYADADFPSFDKSAMDGYAIRAEEIHKKLQIIEFIPAGKKPEKSIESGSCSAIMTGAMVPEGADMVVMKEDVVVEGESITIINPDSKINILKKGEDVKTGSLILTKGVGLNPIHLGLLASVGATKPAVYKRPPVSVLSTGDELVTPSESPVPPKIRNSNSAQLVALAKEAGAHTIDFGQIPDNHELIYQTVRDAMTSSDIVVLTGGASVGDLDFTGEVFEKLNAKINFTKLAIQPGKPILFATTSDKYLFGLSGNPVSSFVQFHLLVKPLIDKLCGRIEELKVRRFPLSVDMKRRRSERMLFFPVMINDSMEVEPIEYHGSAHLSAYQEAEGMASFPIGLNELKKATIVDVRPI